VKEAVCDEEASQEVLLEHQKSESDYLYKEENTKKRVATMPLNQEEFGRTYKQQK